MSVINVLKAFNTGFNEIHWTNMLRIAQIFILDMDSIFQYIINYSIIKAYFTVKHSKEPEI